MDLSCSAGLTMMMVARQLDWRIPVVHLIPSLQIDRKDVPYSLNLITVAIAAYEVRSK